MKRCATIGVAVIALGVVSWLAAQSSACADVAWTTVTGGTVLQNFVATNATSYALDLTPFNIFVGPGETLTVSGAATNSGQVGVGLTWDEAN